MPISLFPFSHFSLPKPYMGHKDAGIYVSRSKAAYWDGRNEAGELVSSGIYFYTIQAGEFTATKKMIVAK